MPFNTSLSDINSNSALW